MKKIKIFVIVLCIMLAPLGGYAGAQWEINNVCTSGLMPERLHQNNCQTLWWWDYVHGVARNA